MKNKKILSSFKHAFEGIFSAIKDERNMKIHLVMMLLVIIAGIILKLSLIEWVICLILFALVISFELINTALEALTDATIKEIHPLAKKAKDCAAGAVLFSAIIAAIVGLIIFIPKIIDLFR